MKRTGIRVIVLVVVLIAIAVVVVSMSLGAILRKGVVTIGSRITQTDVQLKEAKLSLLSGTGDLKGFVLGNPKGYQSDAAVRVDAIVLAVRPGSILSDKIHLTKIYVIQPVITFEQALPKNNLKEILDNIEAASSPDRTKSPAEKEGGKKLQVDDLLIRDAEVSIVTPFSKPVKARLPEIHLQNLGQGPEGITPAELAKRILEQLLAQTLQVAQGSAGDILGRAGSAEAVRKLGTNAPQQMESIRQGLEGILGKPK